MLLGPPAQYHLVKNPFWKTLLLNKQFRLENSRVLITPLGMEHLGRLTEIGCNPLIWQYNYRFDCRCEADIKIYIERALYFKEEYSRIPFVVFDKTVNNIVGTTSFYSMHEDFGSIGMGYTWYGVEYQRKGLNIAVSSLLYDFCFNTLKCRRLELHINTENMQSKAATEKAGAKQEGVIRNAAIFRDTGKKVDMALYSILPEEYQQIKQKIHIE